MTKRSRFIVFNKEQEKQLGEMVLEVVSINNTFLKKYVKDSEEVLFLKIFLKFILYHVIFFQHLEAHKKDLVLKTHPAYKRLLRVIEKILVANEDLKSIRDTKWTLTVIDTPLSNSYILPVNILILYSNIYLIGFPNTIFILFVFLGWKYLRIFRYLKNNRK